jgi:hypothetical protein
VELGGPLAILAGFDHIRFCDDYDWHRHADKLQMTSNLGALIESERVVFSHPIKLSLFEPAELEGLRPATACG